MKREIREVDPVRGIVQITMPDERWYAREVSIDGTAENARVEYVPSVTWITSFYPKDERFVRWVAKLGWERAEEERNSAGEKGDKVHQGMRRLVEGVSIDTTSDLFQNNRTGAMETLAPKEIFCLETLVEWIDKEKPEFIDCERTVWNEKYKYAGTLDLLCRIKSTGYRVVHLIDVKTSPSIFTPMELQVSSYKHADISIPPNTRLAILQVGYEKNKIQKYKFTPVADKFPLFLAIRKIWEEETGNSKPFQRDYPLSLSLAK